jgi:hypothetical protein
MAPCRSRAPSPISVLCSSRPGGAVSESRYNATRTFCSESRDALCLRREETIPSSAAASRYVSCPRLLRHDSCSIRRRWKKKGGNVSGGDREVEI